MKLNLSVDGKNFKNQVIDLRKKLNECQTNGVLNDDFEEQLNKLSQIEEELLAELIPYYRVYANSIKKTSMQIKPLKQLGAFRFDSFLQPEFPEIITREVLLPGSHRAPVVSL